MPQMLHQLVHKSLPKIQVHSPTDEVKDLLLSSLRARVGDVFTSVGYPILSALCHPKDASLEWLGAKAKLREDAWERMLEEACRFHQASDSNLSAISKEELRGLFLFLFLFFHFGFVFVSYCCYVCFDLFCFSLYFFN